MEPKVKIDPVAPRMRVVDWISVTIISGMLACATCSPEQNCPQLQNFRSSAVASSFDSARMQGLWYEQAYIDIAQVGATCQTLNGTLPDANGVFKLSFSVKYGSEPFTIGEVYTPASSGGEKVRGLYSKTADVPGGKLLVLPTVIVDVTGDDNRGLYQTAIIYSCKSALGVDVTEIIFATRSPTANATLQAEMEAKARALGVQWSKNLTYVDHQRC